MNPATMESMPRTYVIRKSQHLGYGFVAGDDGPTMVKIVANNGPSYKRLIPGDIIMAVNGINVETAPQEQVIKMIKFCGDQIEIKVRQPTYEELIKAKNLSNPNTLNKSCSNVNNIMNNRRPDSPLNRLVTSISQQQNLNQSSSPDSHMGHGETPPVQLKVSSKNNNILKQKLNNLNHNNNDEDFSHINARTLDRKNQGYGRHSPMPQRCKSSIDVNQKNNSNKKNDRDQDNEQPLLKRSNTMRPVRPPAKVMEIFQVVIKVFFEDDHSRMLNYNQDTIVATILETLNNRLIKDSPHAVQIKSYFGLAITVGVNEEPNHKEQLTKKKLLHVLDENDSIMKIRQLPYAHRLRLLYRMVSPPADVSNLYLQDKFAFEYLYQQSCNDLKLERFQPELDQEVAIKLSALHLLEYVHTNFSKSHGNSKDPKVYVHLVKKSPGLKFFLPASIGEGLVDKKGRKCLTQYKKIKIRLLEHMKKNFDEFDFEPPKAKSTTNLNRYSSTSFHELCLPEMKNSPSDYIKLLFLNYLSQLPCYRHSKCAPRPCASSPTEANSAGECSSSLESVPRTSDSSPLLRQEKNQISQPHPPRLETNINLSKLAQMNSVRSLNSIQSSNACQPIDQPDMAQTPSIESVSSITFNIHNSPSPQQTASSHPPLDDLLRKVIPLPPPTMQSPLDTLRRSGGYLTQILTDTDLDKLRCPPPPPRSSRPYYDDNTNIWSNMYPYRTPMRGSALLTNDRSHMD